MAAVARAGSDDGRRTALSPRPKGRESAKDTLCRNVTIYGHCRYEDKGCAFNHDPVKPHTPQVQADSLKKRLTVDSPSFTPSTAVSNGVKTGLKSAAISPKAANAAPFKPKGLTAGLAPPQTKPYNPTAPDWAAPETQEFLPQAYHPIPTGETNGATTAASPYDPFTAAATSLATANHAAHQPQVNPYTQDTNNMGGASYYQGQNSFAQPLQYHLYAPLGPHRENLLPYQRAAHDFFISDGLREELQRKSAATLQTLPNSTLPAQIDYFHSLVPLDTSNQKNATLFGYPSWVYKAVSSKDGNTYALRRLEGYRLTNEKAIRPVQGWKRVTNGNVVTVVDAFTNRSFGDSSLIFITDYHPLSKTLAEQHFTSQTRYQTRAPSVLVPEPVLWSYVVQIASALKAIHMAGLAARIIDPTKILLTSKNRIRLNACAILDVVQFDTQRTILDLQREDLLQFGRLILGIGTNNPLILHNVPKGMEQFARSYSQSLKESVFWLLDVTSPPQQNKSIDLLISGISSQIIASFDSTLHLDDQLNTELNRELENSRILRLMTKLNFINERPDHEHDRQWSENGERYYLKLFRDYVFHQVEAQGNPVIDLAHVLGCLNKLDAGLEEKVLLTSRDEQTSFVVTYRELKRGVESAFQDLMKSARRGM